MSVLILVARADMVLKTVGATVAPADAVEEESAEIQAEAETDASGIPAEVLAAVEAEATPAREWAS